MRLRHTRRAIGVILSLGLGLGGFACAQAMTTEQAIEALLGKNSAAAAAAWPLTQQGTGRIAPASPATRMNDDDRPTLVVPRGATLAALLAPMLRQVSVPKAAVFEAFVQLNPHAFVRGNANRLMAGATVRMFSDADIARLNGVDDTSPQARRGWVRFP